RRQLAGLRRLFPWPARNAVVGDGSMGDIGAVTARHVAGDAVVAVRPPLCLRQSTAAVGVARLAAVAVIRLLLGCGWQPVRVVAGGTTHPASARLEATTGVHLLCLTHRVVRRLGRIRDKNRPKQVKRQSWPEVGVFSAGARDALQSLQVALLANRFTQRRLKM